MSSQILEAAHDMVLRNKLRREIKARLPEHKRLAAAWQLDESVERHLEPNRHHHGYRK